MKLKCPECDSNGPFKAMVSFMIETSEDSRVGNLDLNTPFWEFIELTDSVQVWSAERRLDAYMECLECGFEGTRQDFYTDGRTE